jgi:hypothetical protein
MSWLEWIFAYLFDCVHPHTTWPRRNRAGLVYVCCVDCGRELPYSLEYMKITTEETRHRKAWGTGLGVAGSRILISAILLFNSGRAAAQTSDGTASETRARVPEPVPELVVVTLGLAPTSKSPLVLLPAGPGFTARAPASH